MEGVEVFELSLAEVAGVESVAEGVGVAGLGAAFAGSGHGGSSWRGAKYVMYLIEVLPAPVERHLGWRSTWEQAVAGRLTDG